MAKHVLDVAEEAGREKPVRLHGEGLVIPAVRHEEVHAHALHPLDEVPRGARRRGSSASRPVRADRDRWRRRLVVMEIVRSRDDHGVEVLVEQLVVVLGRHTEAELRAHRVERRGRCRTRRRDRHHRAPRGSESGCSSPTSRRRPRRAAPGSHRTTCASGDGRPPRSVVEPVPAARIRSRYGHREYGVVEGDGQAMGRAGPADRTSSRWSGRYGPAEQIRQHLVDLARVPLALVEERGRGRPLVDRIVGRENEVDVESAERLDRGDVGPDIAIRRREGGRPSANGTVVPSVASPIATARFAESNTATWPASVRERAARARNARRDRTPRRP